MATEKLVILWHTGQYGTYDSGEWDTFAGDLEEAIRSVKTDHRYRNYGRHGATIIRAGKLYEIRAGDIETTFLK